MNERDNFPTLFGDLYIGGQPTVRKNSMTGISPIMLDDLTSGFNIATNLTMDGMLNEMLGFTEADVRTIIDGQNIDMDRDLLMTDLQANYNGYLFSIQADCRVYNPDMILYFFGLWRRTGQYPNSVIDDNMRIPSVKYE